MDIVVKKERESRVGILDHNLSPDIFDENIGRADKSHRERKYSLTEKSYLL